MNKAMFAKRQAWLFYAHLLTVIVYVQIEDERSDGHAVEKFNCMLQERSALAIVWHRVSPA